MKRTLEDNIVTAMQNSSGRFFSLGVKNRERPINAQFVEQTPKTVIIYDRNEFEYRRLNKSSLRSLSMGKVCIS
jgi:hypothetical protein